MQDTIKNIDYALQVLKILKDNTSQEKPISKRKLLDKLVELDTSVVEEAEDEVKEKKDKYRDKKRDKHRKVLNRLLKTFTQSIQDDGTHNLPEIKQDKKGNWYYDQAISKEMADYLIEALQFSQTIEPEQVNKLIEKVKLLAGEAYSAKSQALQVVKYSNIKRILREKVQTNMAVIQEAIKHNAKISFVFQKYIYNKNAKKPEKPKKPKKQEKEVEYEYHLELVPKREGRYTVSPYYIVAYNSRYYLIANTDSLKQDEVYNNLSIYRLDLMADVKLEEVKVLTVTGKRVTEYVPRRKQKEIRELDATLSAEELMEKHLNMFYDDPRWVRLLLHRDRYFALINAGIENFEVVREKVEEKVNGEDCDEVLIKNVSPEAIIQWAIQYSDYVKLKEPESVCRKMKEKIEALSKMYFDEKEKKEKEITEEKKEK